MKTILVADDEFDILSSIKVVLESEGYKVITCGNGKEALSIIEQMQPDLLITDTTMPHMSGLELLQELAKSKSRVRMRSILMSNVRPEKKQKELKWEAILIKPFTLDQLITTVRRVVPD